MNAWCFAIKSNDVSMIIVKISRFGDTVRALQCSDNKTLKIKNNRISFSSLTIQEYFYLSSAILLAKNCYKNEISRKITTHWQIKDTDLYHLPFLDYESKKYSKKRMLSRLRN